MLDTLVEKSNLTILSWFAVTNPFAHLLNRLLLIALPSW